MVELTSKEEPPQLSYLERSVAGLLGVDVMAKSVMEI